MRYDFRLLGDLEVRVGGDRQRPLPLKPRRLLAALLLEPRRHVTRSRLVDAVWDGEPPRSAHGALQVYASQVRTAIRDVRLVHRAGGYLLDIDPESVDLHRFRALVGHATGAAPAAGAELLRRALAAFRGSPLADLGPGLLHREFEPVVTEERLTAWERLAELELTLGRSAELVPQLVQLTREHPLRERFHELLIVALARQGRIADASATYRRAYRLLRDELGVDPGPGLRAAHRRVLGAEPGHSDQPGSNMLPRDLTDFVGRAAELTEAARVTAEPRSAPALLQISGMAGVGKTVLATRLAHQQRAAYPDGQLFVDLHGCTQDREPLAMESALGLLLGMLGAEAGPDPALNAARWRALLASRRMIVVLDNAVDARQVQPLLPGNSASLVIVTSRTAATVDGAHPIRLGVLDPADAVELFTRVAGAPAATDPASVAHVVRLCGHLPLAVRLAAARLRHRPAWPIRELARRLDDGLRLEELAAGDRSVEGVFEASYRALPEPEQRMFRLLSLVPGDEFDVPAASGATGLPVPAVRRLLENLLDRNLLEQHRPHQFRLHGLMRLYAAKLWLLDRAAPLWTAPVTPLPAGRALPRP
ncbi:BTAD domain-containing putative transcriptional regulator [Micromonospora echinospora]|uniref:AfsR/SARP family transcriptional regulator n=1 Tax=Micromonospora echinospora TaxID=1877 RepID=UPI0033D66631